MMMWALYYELFYLRDFVDDQIVKYFHCFSEERLNLIICVISCPYVLIYCCKSHTHTMQVCPRYKVCTGVQGRPVGAVCVCVSMVHCVVCMIV